MRQTEKIIVIIVLAYIGILAFISEKTAFMNQSVKTDDVVKLATNKIQIPVTSRHPAKIPEEESKPVPPQIVILTYMRSGSSFIGDILQHDPGSFYVFEPLRMIQHAVRAGRPILFQNGSWRAGDNFLEVSADALNSWFACKPEYLMLEVWDDGFLTSKSNRAKVFAACFQKVKPKLGVEKARAMCVKKLKDVCLDSKNIVFKVIRMPMYIFDSLLERNPNMRIIHLIRDPRPTLRSQRFFGNFKDSETSWYAARYCDRVLRDIIAAEVLERKYPGRILKVMYEDLANKPIPMSKKLYKFTGLHYTAEVETFIRNLTAGKISKECAKDRMCTMKSDSSAIAEEWRQKVSFDFVQTVDKSCRSLLYELNLKEIPDLKHLQDKKFKLYLGKKKFDDFRWS